MLYLVLGITWSGLCYKVSLGSCDFVPRADLTLHAQNRGSLIAIQHYITGMLVLLTIEMASIYRYYSYINGSGQPGVAKFLLILVAVLNSARNSLSFFMLLITAMGYGVVRPSLGPIMMKVSTCRRMIRFASSS